MLIETENLVNVATAADRLNLKRQFVWALIRAGRFVPIVIDKTSFIRLDDLRNYQPRKPGRPTRKPGRPKQEEKGI